jgi:POT family proton-dependent oligopeptide transporter
MMGTVFLSMFLANITIGMLGGFYERMTALQFWALHAAIAAAGGILALLLNRRLKQVFAAAADAAARD